MPQHAKAKTAIPPRHKTTLPAVSHKRAREERRAATVTRLREAQPRPKFGAAAGQIKTHDEPAQKARASLPPINAPAHPVMTGTTEHRPIKPPPAVLLPDLERLRQADAKGLRKGTDEGLDERMAHLMKWQAEHSESLVRMRGAAYFLTSPGRQWLEAWYSQTGYHHLLPQPKTKGRKPASETLVGSSFISRYQLNRIAVKLKVTQQDALAAIVEDAYRQLFPEG